MEQLKTMLDFFFSTQCSPDKKRNIVFVGGGEPLLSWDLLKSAVLYAQEQAARREKDLSVEITTNTSLFNDDKIDFILDIFFRVIRSKAPLDYQVCLLIEEDNKVLQDERLRNLINLGFMNKISMLSNVAYRYKFVENPKYETSMLGLFQKNNNTIEVHEFIEPYAQF